MLTKFSKVGKKRHLKENENEKKINNHKNNNKEKAPSFSAALLGNGRLAPSRGEARQGRPLGDAHTPPAVRQPPRSWWVAAQASWLACAKADLLSGACVCARWGRVCGGGGGGGGGGYQFAVHFDRKEK